MNRVRIIKKLQIQVENYKPSDKDINYLRILFRQLILIDEIFETERDFFYLKDKISESLEYYEVQSPYKLKNTTYVFHFLKKLIECIDEFKQIIMVECDNNNNNFKINVYNDNIYKSLYINPLYLKNLGVVKI